jgi:hypothetical protein
MAFPDLIKRLVTNVKSLTSKEFIEQTKKTAASKVLQLNTQKRLESIKPIYTTPVKTEYQKKIEAEPTIGGKANLAIQETGNALKKGFENKAVKKLFGAIKGTVDLPDTLAGLVLENQPIKEGEKALDYLNRVKQGSDVIAERVGSQYNLPSSATTGIALGLGILTPSAGDIGKVRKLTSEAAEEVSTKTGKVQQPLRIQKEELLSQPPIRPNVSKQIVETPSSLPLEPKLPQITEEIQDPVKKVINALQKAKPIRGKQETLYTEERGKRLAKSLSVGAKTSGEKGFYAELGQLKGELPKVEFENIRNKLSQSDIDDLFNKVKDSRLISEWEKISARQGLAKLFGEYGGKVPTESELGLMNKVFGKEFTDTLLNKRPLWEKVKEAGYQLANIPRSIMSSLDLSAPFRQGIFLIGKPKQFVPAFIDMFKAFGSEKSFKAINESIVNKKSFPLMRDSKLALTEMDSTLSLREEKFMSNWAEKIPVAGKLIRASGRAYSGFLNKLRADVFDDLVNKAQKIGLDPNKDRDLSKSIAEFVNNASGRGSLGSLERSATALNSFFFSPRLMASRLNLLNPVYYIKQNPFVRKEAIKSLLTFTGTISTVLGLAKMGGAEVQTDPRNSDFGKIKIGNTRLDIMGGFQQYIRMASQLITGKYISSTTGKEYTLGEGYKPLTRFDILLRQIESKEAPIFSFITDMLRQQDYAGQPVNVVNEIRDRFIPMMIQDVVDVYKDDPSLIPLSALGLFGVSLQTYLPKETNKKTTGNRFSL